MESDDRLRTLLEAVLGPEAGALSEEAGPGSIATWDSVAHLSLILAIEAEFAVTFASAELQDLNTVGKLRARLRST